MLIKLTRTDGQVWAVNPDQVVSVDPIPGGSQVRTTKGSVQNVTEIPEEVEQLVAERQGRGDR